MTRRLLIIGTWLLIATICRSHPVMNAYLEMVESDDGTTSVIWRHPSSTATGMNLEPLYPGEVKAAATLPSQDEGGYLREYYVLKGAPRFWSGCAIGLKGTTSGATEVLVRLKLANGQTQVAVLRGPADVFIVPEQAGRGQAAAAYFQLGVDHILKGVDHLLFVLGLLLLVPGRLMLIKTITSFTVAHSITLAIATLGYASAPLPPLNVAIALSIFYLGPEIIRQQRGKTSLTIRHPWLIAFVFGLLHWPRRHPGADAGDHLVPRLAQRLPPAGAGQLAPPAAHLPRGVWGLLLIVIVIGGIYKGLFTPTEAAAMSAVYAFIVAVFVYKDMPLKAVPKVLLSSANMSAMLLYIITNAVLFSFVLTNENIPHAIADWIVTSHFGEVGFLLVVNVLLLAAGNFMEPSSIVLIMAPILFPVAMRLGINPVHFGIVMTVNMEVGMCHPPVGLNLYVASGIAKMGITELTIAVAPWLLTMLIFLGLITYVPEISLWLPRTLGML